MKKRVLIVVASLSVERGGDGGYLPRSNRTMS
jgi:hypothetical protein